MCAPVQRNLFVPEKRENFFVVEVPLTLIIKLNKVYGFFILKISISCLIEFMHNIQ